MSRPSFGCSYMTLAPVLRSRCHPPLRTRILLRPMDTIKNIENWFGRLSMPMRSRTVGTHFYNNLFANVISASSASCLHTLT